jgi:nicotinamidase-related amidase
MQPLEDEIVLVGKRGLSGFSNTNLQALLEANGIRNLFVCGFLTNLCVQTTAISAYDNGYRTRIIADACASGSPQIQQYVEETICPVLGGLVKSDDVPLLF